MALAHSQDAIVSSDSDLLILVDENDVEIGSADKGRCHDGNGLLHRAFSVLLFNSSGELLIQKRAKGKRLWGDFWSNTCCSHPRFGETMDYASQRRLQEEVGLQAELTYLYKFQYHADFGEAGAESELCYVYIGVSDDKPVTNSNEVSECRYISPDELNQELEQNADAFTPWFKLEWQTLIQDHKHQLDALLAKAC